MRPFFSFVVVAILFIGTISTVRAQNANDFLPAENVFDNLSVDLKVNGSDGPVSVAVGERITISWESDGAKRCRGNWSKNDLRLNGKIAGKLSRSLVSSITVRIACIDADGNREDDSVILNISGISPLPFKNPVTQLPPPPAEQPTIISSCGEIMKSGRYSLKNDLTSPDKICINIHDTSGVEFDCQSHMIIGKNENYTIFVQKVSDFKIYNCKLMSSLDVSADASAQHVLRIEESKNGSLSDSTIGGNFASVASSKDIIVRNNKFTNQFSVYRSTGIKVERNDFSSKAVVALTFDGGSDNSAISNTIDGKSDGIFNNKIGADDGIVIRDESRDIIQENFIQNVYDCGIENIGNMYDSKIIGNRIKNSGGCVLGGWYNSSVKGNVIKDNVGDDVRELFLFYREYALRQGETEVYFKDNFFENNTLINPRLADDVPPHASQITIESNAVPASSVVVGNNIFRNNDFTTVLRSIIFKPVNMIIDGGGNICPKSEEKDFPLACGRQ